MDLHSLTPRRFHMTVVIASVACLAIVGTFAALGRAAMNLRAALTDKPDVGIYLLLEKEGISDATLLRESTDGKERDYVVQTREGQKYVKLKKGEKQWYVAEEESMHQ